MIGHHSHTIQPFYKKNDAIVYYSLGNFCFDELVSINGKMKLKQNMDNKMGIILEMDIDNGKVVGTNEFYIIEKENKIILCDIKNEIEDINYNYNNLNADKYIEMRDNQIKRNKLDKFGKKDLNWIKSKLNYYSIGAFILRKKNQVMYNRHISKSKWGVK